MNINMADIIEGLDISLFFAEYLTRVEKHQWDYHLNEISPHYSIRSLLYSLSNDIKYRLSADGNVQVKKDSDIEDELSKQYPESERLAELFQTKLKEYIDHFKVILLMKETDLEKTYIFDTLCIVTTKATQITGFIEAVRLSSSQISELFLL